MNSRKGSQKFAILLCKFTDTAGNEPHPKSYFDDFLKRYSGGLNDYWVKASLGVINLDGSVVFDWKTLPVSNQLFIDLNVNRGSKAQAAIEAHKITPSDYVGVIAIFNSSVNDGGTIGSFVVAGPDWNSTFLAHESGHVLGLSHSFDQSDRKDATWSAPGEYFDNYDIMSAMNVLATPDPKFGTRGPLLCTANQDLMGWLPQSRTFEPASGQSSSGEIELVSLGHSEIPGYLCAQLGGFYVEFRTNDGWDSGLKHPCVLIHTMSGKNAVVIAQNESLFVNEFLPGQTFGPPLAQVNFLGGIRIEIISFNIKLHTARIRFFNQIRKPIRIPQIVGEVFGGVAVDGGGFVLVGSVVIRIPPRSPLIGLVERIGIISQAEEVLRGTTKAAVTAPVYREISDIALKSVKHGTLALDEADRDEEQ